MKNQITSLVALSLAFVSSAQLTLSSGNTPHSPSYEADRNIFSGGTVPLHGNNMTYDYSNVSTSNSDMIPYMPAVRTGFESSTRFSYGSASLGGIPLFSEYYTHKDETGIYRTGSYKLPQAVGLGTLSGNNSDTVHFPGNNSIFANPVYDIKFPASYGSTWESSYMFDVDFNLTISAFGLNGTPGYRHQHCLKTDTVIGSGTLKLPGGSQGSFEYPVILVKSTISYIDSTFLGGAPAPDQLLGALGLTQGFQSSINEYYFYAADFERPLLYLSMSSNWENIQFSYYSPKGVEHLSTNSLQASDSKMYPNPVQAGELLTFATTSSSEPTSMRIMTLNGIEIMHENISSMPSESFSIQIPSHLSKGLYICQLIDKTGAVILNNKVTIID